MITQDELKNILKYDKSNGLFTWIVKPSGNVKVGSVAGHKNTNGYVEIKINKKVYKAHRLAWLYVYGEVPLIIDHINNQKDDNRIFNLRNVTQCENARNSITPKNNTSGIKNVSYDKQSKKWRVYVTLNNKRINIGRFDDIEFAELVAIEARNKYYMEFACHE